MRDKVNEEESLAESYAEIADATTSIDEEIDKTLEGDASDSVVSDLERLKNQLKK
jgi:phage shock protein A